VIIPFRLVEYLLARSRRLHLAALRARGTSSGEKLAFVALVGGGDTVWDVGANVGYFTVLFSDLVGRAGSVHSFEPMPETFARLSANVRRRIVVNNVRLHNVACANETGDVALHLPGGDYGQASLSNRHRGGSWSQQAAVTTFRCRGVRLDEYEELNSLHRVNFLKCDVEGAELLALSGARSTLVRDQPVLCLEVSGDWTRSFDYSPSEIMQFLQGVGYDWFALCGGSSPAFQISAEEAPDRLECDSTLNLLAAVRSRHSARISRLLSAGV
jgi:FkbM family methyltransferase